MRRKTKADSATYKRIMVVRNCRAPSGRPWVKPTVVIDALEADIVAARLKGQIDKVGILQGLYDFAVATLERSKRDVGNVALHYAWEQYQGQGRVMSETDVMCAVDSDIVSTWYHDTIVAKRVESVVIEAECSKPDRLREEMLRNRALAKAERKRLRREAWERSQRAAEGDAKLAAIRQAAKEEAALMERLRKAVG